MCGINFIWAFSVFLSVPFTQYVLFFSSLFQIMCRCTTPLDNSVKEKISMFCHVEPEQVRLDRLEYQQHKCLYLNSHISWKLNVTIVEMKKYVKLASCWNWFIICFNHNGSHLLKGLFRIFCFGWTVHITTSCIIHICRGRKTPRIVYPIFFPWLNKY